MINIAAECEETFVTVCDVGLDLLWRHARVEGRYDNDRNLNRWKEIYRHTRNCCNSDNHDDHARHENKERILDCKEGHGYFPPFWFALWNSVNLLDASCGVTC